MKSHKDLIVWQKSMEHVSAVYVARRAFPQEELFGIVSQLRRAAVSIPSNIAEGYGSLYGKETLKFLSNALGSASEVETQLIISRNLAFMSEESAQELIDQTEEIVRMLTALIKSLN